MIDICIALDQSVSPHTGVRAIQNTGVFLQAVFQTPRPHSFFLDRGSAAKTLITQYTIPPAAQAIFRRERSDYRKCVCGSQARETHYDFYSKQPLHPI